MSATARRDVFQAISDPTRREIINIIAHQPMNLNAIADQFEISRPAISNHIKILEECGMVQITQYGRERFCEAKLDTMAEVNDWIDQYRQFWMGKFDLLDKYIDKIHHKKIKR
ncbi:MAG: ArsR family transcriptional regulator [Chitinophagaceae bacterium]|nr:MAG: ArsR family transcriptional regulator [Chitinophagaceae bacterium]